MELILTFLGRNWIWVAVGIVFALMMGYIGILKIEISLQEDTIAEQALVINIYKAKEVALEKENKRITEAHAETLKRYKEEILKNLKSTVEKIKLNEELNRTRVTLAAVRLFNESKRDPNIKDTTPTIEGDDGGTEGPGTVSLADIFEQVAVNDSNHLRCVAQVKEWQHFWQEYVSAVNIINPGDTRMSLERIGVVKWKDN